MRPNRTNNRATKQLTPDEKILASVPASGEAVTVTRPGRISGQPTSWAGVVSVWVQWSDGDGGAYIPLEYITQEDGR